MKYFIIDALGPFIDPDNPPYNWSKVPFSYYEKLEDSNTSFAQIETRFKTFIKKIKSIGYNAISIDDLPHMVIPKIYSKAITQKLKKFLTLYKKLVQISNDNKIKVFVNFDIMYFNPDIERFTNCQDNKNIEFLKQSLKILFEDYQVAGVITRFGECDGVDVQGIFKSKVVLQKPKQAKKYLQALLPVFEYYQKDWVFRTWTIGGSTLGDLMWNKKTFLKVFNNINSPNLIISMKYGESDFFRNMELNPLFYLKSHKKIIELQAKREYDFFGELPYYTGFQYKKYFDELNATKDLLGIMVWCQTGGWIKSNKINFLKNSSPFVELNTVSTINIFKGADPEKEIENYFQNKKMIIFLRKFEELSDKILYPIESKERYFKKLYVPPIVWVYWNNISINNFMTSFVKYFYKESPDILESEFRELYEMGKNCKVSKIDFYIDTLQVLYLTRKALHNELSDERISKAIEEYNSKYDFLSFSLQDTQYSKKLILLFKLLFRTSKRYRLIDILFFNRVFFNIFFKFYFAHNKKLFPKFTNNFSMPLSEILK